MFDVKRALLTGAAFTVLGTPAVLANLYAPLWLPILIALALMGAYTVGYSHGDRDAKLDCARQTRELSKTVFQILAATREDIKRSRDVIERTDS